MRPSGDVPGATRGGRRIGHTRPGQTRAPVLAREHGTYGTNGTNGTGAITAHEGPRGGASSSFGVRGWAHLVPTLERREEEPGGPGAWMWKCRGGPPRPPTLRHARRPGSMQALWTKWTSWTLWTAILGFRVHEVHAVHIVHSSAPSGLGRGCPRRFRRLTPPAIIFRRFAAGSRMGVAASSAQTSPPPTQGGWGARGGCRPAVGGGAGALGIFRRSAAQGARGTPPLRMAAREAGDPARSPERPAGALGIGVAPSPKPPKGAALARRTRGRGRR